MRAVIVKPGQKDSARLKDLPTPEPGPGEVRVRVLQVGIDGTDIEINSGLYGETPPGEDYLIIGHEAVGVVDKLSPGVTGISEGDLVVPTVRRGCTEQCLNCQYLEPDMCLTGNYEERGILKIQGYMADYFTEKPEYLLKIPQELKDIGMFVEPLSVVEKALTQIFKIQKRLHWTPEIALVLGVGNIGLLAAFLLRNMEVNTYALDIVPEDSAKAGLIRKVGARYIDGRKNLILNLPNAIGKPDLIIEATGHSTIAFEAMQILRNNGVLCLISVTSGQTKKEICIDCINNDLVMGNRVIFGSVSSNRGHFQKAIDHMKEIDGKWSGIFNDMITRRIPVENFKEGLAKEPEDIKTVLMF